VTDITLDPNARSGDWQQGGTPYNANVVFGTWKAAARTVDTTVTPNVTSITPDADPAKNNWKLGGGDPVPAAVMSKKDEGFGAEVRWDLVLLAGHSYRIQAMVHDGDQTKDGGDSGEACVNFCAENACPEGATPCTGSVTQENVMCSSAPGSVCVNGCCIVGAPPIR
jgi:hypothetical protein